MYFANDNVENCLVPVRIIETEIDEESLKKFINASCFKHEDLLKVENVYTWNSEVCKTNKIIVFVYEEA